MPERPHEHRKVKYLVRMNDAWNDDPPLQQVDHAADRIGNSTNEERLDEVEAVTLREDNAIEDAEPTHRQVNRQPQPRGEIVQEDRFQNDAGERRGPDADERPPA